MADETNFERMRRGMPDRELPFFVMPKKKSPRKDTRTPEDRKRQDKIRKASQSYAAPAGSGKVIYVTDLSSVPEGGIALWGANVGNYATGTNSPRAGQAYAAYGKEGWIGIPTKYSPSIALSDFDLDGNAKWRELFDAQIAKARAVLEAGGTVYVPRDGLGTGRANLPEGAPKVWELLNLELAKLGINNDPGLQDYEFLQKYEGVLPQDVAEAAVTPENTKNLPDGVTKFHPTYGEVKVGETKGEISRITLADGTDRKTLTANLFDTAEAAASATVAQGIEQGTSKPLAAGSNPAGGATLRPGIPGGDGQRRAPLDPPASDSPDADRPIAEIVAERLNEFADMRATSAKRSRFTGGQRTAPGRPNTSSMMDRSVGAAGVFGESYERPGQLLPGIDKSRTIQSRLSALFQSVGYTPDAEAGEFLKGKLVPTNDLVAEVMGEMISAIKLLNRPNSPLTPEHRAELGAIVLELSRILHEVADPRTRRMFEKLTKKTTVQYGDSEPRRNPYFGTVSEGADVFYPGGAVDPFAGKTNFDKSGPKVKATIRRLAAADILGVPDSSMGEEPSRVRSLAVDQTGLYEAGAGVADEIQVSRLQKALDETGLFDGGETDKASLHLEIDTISRREGGLRGEAPIRGDVEESRLALRTTMASELAPLLQMDELIAPIRKVTELSPLTRDGGFGAPVAFKTNVPYRSNLVVASKKKKLDININLDDPRPMSEVHREWVRAEVRARIDRTEVLIKAIDATADGEYRVQKDAAKRRLQAWLSESIRKFRSENLTIGETLDLVDGFEDIIDMELGERTLREELGYTQESLRTAVDEFNRGPKIFSPDPAVQPDTKFSVVTVESVTTIKVPKYIIDADARRKAKVRAEYDRLVAEFGEDFAKAYALSEEGAKIFGNIQPIPETITLEPGTYLIPSSLNVPAAEFRYTGDTVTLSASVKVSPKYIVLKNGTIVSARSGESGFLQHRKVYPYRVREVDGGVFTDGKGLKQERRYEIERIDQARYEATDPNQRIRRADTRAILRRLDALFSDDSNEITAERADPGETVNLSKLRQDLVDDSELGLLATDLEEIIALDAYESLEILALNGDSAPDLEAELLRAIGEVKGEIRLDRFPQYARTRLASLPAKDTGGLRGRTVSVKDAVRAVRPGISELESRTNVESVLDILNRESSAQEPTVTDDNVAINSIRRAVTFLYRLAKDATTQLGYGGAKRTRRIIVADLDSAAGYGTASRFGDRTEAAIDQINDAGLLAARAAVESVKAILHAGWSEGLDPKHTRTRFETTQTPVGTIRQAPDGQTIPAGSADTQDAARRIRRYIPGMEDVGIPLSRTATDSALYIMRASEALGAKATKFFNRYFEQAGLLDPKNQDVGASVDRAFMTLEEFKTAQLFEGFSSEDAVQIISELEAAYRRVGSVLRTGEQTPIKFRVLERETPEEATLRVLKAIAAVDEKERAQAKARKPVSSSPAPSTPSPARNITAFDVADGLTEEGVLIENADDYSWKSDGDNGFVEQDFVPYVKNNPKVLSKNAKVLAKLISYKLFSLGGISKEGVRVTMNKILIEESLKTILPTSKKDLDKMFIELYKELSGSLDVSDPASQIALVRHIANNVPRESLENMLLKVYVDAEPQVPIPAGERTPAEPQVTVTAEGKTGKVQKIRVTERGGGIVAAESLLPMLRQMLEVSAKGDLDIIARPIYDALYQAAPLSDRPEPVEMSVEEAIANRPEPIKMPNLPKGRYAHGPFGTVFSRIIRSIEQGKIPIQEVELPSDIGLESLVGTRTRVDGDEPTGIDLDLDPNDIEAILSQQYDRPDFEEDMNMMVDDSIKQGKLATLLRPDQGIGFLSPGVKKFDMRLRTPLGGGAAGAAIDIGMAAAGGYLTPENAILSAGLNATNLLSKSPLKAGIIGSSASLLATAATGGDIGRTIFGIVGSIAGGVLGGAFTGGIGAFGGSVGGSLVADEVWKSMFGQQQSNTPLFKPFNPGVNTPPVRIP